MNMNVSKTNGVKLLAVVAVLAMVVCAFAAVMPAEETDAAKDPTYIHGGITSFQDFGKDTEVIIDGDLTIPANTGLQVAGKFTVNEGVTVTIQAGGFLIIADGAKATIDGNIVATGTNTIDPETVKNPTPATDEDSTETGEVDAQADPEEEEKVTSTYPSIVNMVNANTKDEYLTVNGSITLEKGAVMSDSEEAIVADNAADTEPTSKILLTKGASLTVGSRTSNISTIANQNVCLYDGATFSLNGYADNVKVDATGTATYYTGGSITIDSGASVAAPTGNRTVSNVTFTVTVETTSAFTAKTGGDRITLRQYILNIDGEINSPSTEDESDKITAYRETLTINDGAIYNGKLTSGTAAFYAVGADGKAGDAIMPISAVSGTLNMSEYSVLIIDKNAYLRVSGTLDVAYAEADADDTAKQPTSVPTFTNVSGAKTIKTFQIHGTMYVTGTVTGNAAGLYSYPQDSGNNAYFGNLIYVDGGSITLEYDGDFIADMKTGSFGDSHMFGALYVVDGAKTSDPDTVYIYDFDVAVTNATAAEAEELYVFAWGSQNVAEDETADAANALSRGAFEITTDITIPDGMTLYIWNALVVGEKGTLILEDGATVEFTQADAGKRNTAAVLYVLGKVVDNGEVMAGYEDAMDQFVYEVKKVSEDELTATYTSLKMALNEAVDGEEIQLHGQITISEDLTIPANVTVISGADSEADKKDAITINGATLTVNGTLVMSESAGITLKTDGSDKANVVVNNIIVNSDGTNVTYTDDSDYKIAGAYFDGTIGDYESADFITSVAVAGANSTNTSAITIQGKVSMGDVTFTEGELGLAITTAGEVTAGTVTLVGNAVTFTAGGEAADSFTGTVSSAVTAGTSAVSFSKAKDVIITLVPEDDGETITTTMALGITAQKVLAGTATISAGEVYIDGEVTVGTLSADKKDKAVLTVASGATLVVPEEASIIVVNNAAEESYAGLVVDGTLSIVKGTLTIEAAETGADAKDVTAAQVDINGTLDVAGKEQKFAGILNVTGAMNVTSEGDDACEVIVAMMNVGDEDGATGSVSGTISVGDNGYIYAYPGSDMSGAAVDVQDDGTSTANTTEFYINGTLYVTAYSFGSANFGQVMSDSVSLSGYKSVSTWFTTPEMSEDSKIETSDPISDIASAYAEAVPLDVKIQISVGQGMSVYIDNIRYGNESTPDLTVGEHTISVQVNPGYTGTTQILFDGQAVTDGKLIVTADMAKKAPSDGTGSKIVLSVTGDISYETGSTGDDGGMGLTEILLIILVVLIVIMAIMVALRLMRS